MIQTCKKIFGLLSKQQKMYLLLLQIVMISSAILELTSISTIFPLVATASDVSSISENNFVAYIYNTVAFSSYERFLLFLGALFVCAVLISNSVQIVNIYLLSRFALGIGADFSAKLNRYYLSKDVQFYKENSDGALINRVVIDSDRVSQDIMVPVLRLNTKLYSIFFISLLLFLSDVILSVLTFVVLASSYWLVSRITRRFSVKNSIAISTNNKDRVINLNQICSGIRDIKVAGVEDRFSHEYSNSTKTSMRAIANNIMLGTCPYYIIEIIALSGVAVIALYLMLSTAGLGESLPVLALYSMAGYKLLPSFQQAYNAFNSIRGSRASFDNVYPDLRNAVDFVPCKNTKKTMKVKRAIEVKGVCFGYKNRDKLVLEGVSINFPVGTCTAIVGESGSGKSTLVDVLLGFLVPDAGAVYVDDVKVNETNVLAWRQTICYVPQEVYLSNHTIAENISFYARDYEVEINDISKAAIKASADGFISCLPEAYNTYIGDKGGVLSGGQKQKISIARAIFSGREVLIFDEPTSAIDESGTEEIIKAIKTLTPEKTIIIVTHSSIVCNYMDRVYDLESKKFIKNG